MYQVFHFPMRMSYRPERHGLSTDVGLSKQNFFNPRKCSTFLVRDLVVLVQNQNYGKTSTFVKRSIVTIDISTFQSLLFHFLLFSIQVLGRQQRKSRGLKQGLDSQNKIFKAFFSKTQAELDVIPVQKWRAFFVWWIAAVYCSA